jgi:uncharacterized ferredoxin-like protein
MILTMVMQMSPPIIESKNSEKEALLETAKHMLVSARTAPKTMGIDDLHTAIVYGKEKDMIAEEMEKIAQELKNEGFNRDAKNVRDSETIVLIGVKGDKSVGLNCGACGHSTCKEFEAAQKTQDRDFVGPTCLFKALDLGIALGSAAKTASMLNADNRIMYRIGKAALRLKMLSQSTIIMGIPISAKGKSVYFDRGK